MDLGPSALMHSCHSNLSPGAFYHITVRGSETKALFSYYVLPIIREAEEIQQLAYRRKVQRYSGEEASLFEELRYGLFFGTVSFTDKLKSRYLREAPHPEVPQQTMLVKDHGPEKLMDELSVVLGCNPKVFRDSLKISEADKRHRDLMVYFPMPANDSWH